MTLRRKAVREEAQSQRQQGGYYLGCMGYPQCRSALWLPDAMRSVEATDQSCNRV